MRTVKHTELAHAGQSPGCGVDELERLQWHAPLASQSFPRCFLERPALRQRKRRLLLQLPRAEEVALLDLRDGAVTHQVDSNTDCSHACDCSTEPIDMRDAGAG